MMNLGRLFFRWRTWPLAFVVLNSISVICYLGYFEQITSLNFSVPAFKMGIKNIFHTGLLSD